MSLLELLQNKEEAVEVNALEPEDAESDYCELDVYRAVQVPEAQFNSIVAFLITVLAMATSIACNCILGLKMFRQWWQIKEYRTVGTQSQTTYTMVSSSARPSFKVLAPREQGVFT